MLEFWRKIRKKLLDEGNLRRYLVYASGEIILVVIGILIAVQLNNWNQRRISATQIEVLHDKLEVDLVRNIGVIGDIIDIYHVNDTLTRKVIHNQVTVEDYYRNDSLGNLLFRFKIINFDYGNIDKLLEKEEIIDLKYIDVIEAAKEVRRVCNYILPGNRFDH